MLPRLARIALISTLMAASCSTYKRPTLSYLPDPKDESYASQKQALSHPLYTIIPRNREQIRWFDAGHWIMSNAFGNDLDGIFGEGADMNRTATFKRFITWQLRNPMHNFNCYTIGSYGWKHHYHLSLFNIENCNPQFFSTKDPGAVGTGKFAFQFTFNDFKPFVSIKILRLETYAGSRPTGDFGLALRASHKPTPSPNLNPTPNPPPSP